MKVLLTLLLIMIIDTSVGAKKKPNCRFKCYRWDRCMQQLAGNENRPLELGNTGQIVLTKCDMGPCDCNQAQRPAKDKTSRDKAKAKTKVTPQKPRNFSTSSARQTRQRNRLPTSNRNRSLGESSSSSESSSSVSIRRPFRNLLRSRLQPTTTTTEKATTPDAQLEVVKFTDESGRLRVGTVTGTSVSSSISVSTSTNDDRDNKDANIASENMVKQCLTADYGPQRNVLCKFPFKYKNILRNECISDDDPGGKDWCATEVDANLEFSGINWGYCRNTCLETGNDKVTVVTAQSLDEPEIKSADLLMQRLRLYAQKRTRRF